jgi:ankyrin repeat protein
MGHEEVVNELLKRNIKDVERNDGATGLFKATQKGNEAVVKLLLDRNPNLFLLNV